MSSFYSATLAIIENSKGEILMVKEAKDFIQGSWDFPGGGWEDNESIIDCAQREVLEETGYSVEIKNLAGLYKGSSNKSSTETIVFVFTASLKDEKRREELEDDIIEAEFFSPEEIRDLNLREENRLQILEKYEEGETYPLGSLWNQLSLLE